MQDSKSSTNLKQTIYYYKSIVKHKYGNETYFEELVQGVNNMDVNL